MKLNLSVLIATIVAGAVAWGLNALLYNSLVDVCGRPLLIALMLIIAAVIICATLFVTMLITEQSDEEFLFLEGRGPILIGLCAVLVVLFLLGMLLEWIYDHDKQLADVPTSYIFLLDESGSMEGNDPSLERYNAVNTVMNTMPADFPYAVYMFADTTACVREMAPVSQGQFQAPMDVAASIGASTMIKDGLQTVLNDLNSGRFPTSGAAPRVILLTDGVASDMSVLFGSRNILKSYKSAGISVSTVGLGSADENLMSHIAKKTGGTYVHINSAQDLAQGFTAVAAVDTSRDLMSARNLVKLNWLYGLLRILFLTILGAAIAFMKAMACAKEDDTLLIIIAGAVTSLVGAILLELLVAIGLPAIVGQLFYTVLVAITPIQKPMRRPDYGNIPIYY